MWVCVQVKIGNGAGAGKGLSEAGVSGGPTNGRALIPPWCVPGTHAEDCRPASSAPSARTSNTLPLHHSTHLPPPPPPPHPRRRPSQVRLPAGSAIYLPANEPHAYLAGELVECMAASDNVIRAGLTPKFKHADVLCESLTYRQGLPDVLEGSPAGPGGSVRVYQPPFEEFELQKLEVSGGEVALAASQGPRILLVTAGEAEVAAGGGGLPAALEAVKEVERGGVLRRGSIVLLAPGVEFAVRRAEELVGWMAAVNSAFFAIDGAKQGAAGGTGAAVEELVVATVGGAGWGAGRGGEGRGRGEGELDAGREVQLCALSMCRDGGLWGVTGGLSLSA